MKWLVRWRFDYAAKPSKMGMWLRSSNNPIDQAWNKNVGVVKAHIEVKDLDTSLTKVVASCTGDEFRNFSWQAIARLQGSSVIHQLVGLQMWTSEKKVSVYCDGKIKLENLSEEEKKINFATYGK